MSALDKYSFSIYPRVPHSLSRMGMPDLMLFLVMFGQSYLTARLLKKKELECYVLELQQSQGMGTTMDVLLVNGQLHNSDKVSYPPSLFLSDSSPRSSCAASTAPSSRPFVRSSSPSPWRSSRASECVPCPSLPLV